MRATGAAEIEHIQGRSVEAEPQTGQQPLCLALHDQRGTGAQAVTIAPGLLPNHVD